MYVLVRSQLEFASDPLELGDGWRRNHSRLAQLGFPRFFAIEPPHNLGLRRHRHSGDNSSVIDRPIRFPRNLAIRD